MKRDFYSPLMAAVLISVLTSTLLSLVFSFRYSADFRSYSFLTFLGYFIGHIGSYFIILALISFLFLYILRKIFKKFIFERSDFSLFISGFIGLSVFFWVIFFINFNVLRYSPEFLSYLVNVGVVFLGVFIFVLLYKIFPLSFSFIKQKSFRNASIIGTVIVMLLFFMNNPFEEKNIIETTNTKIPSNYKNNGNYLYPKDNLSVNRLNNYMPPQKFEQMFTGEYDGKLLKYRKRGKALPKRITANAFYNLSEDDISYIRALYDAEIFATDFEFAKVLDYLKSKDLYEEAVIIVTSDHGEEFWEHGGTGHDWSLHQHQLKVPLIWKAPFFPDKSKAIFMSAGLIDIYPTLLEGLGIPIPFETQGLSLMPYLKGREYPSRSFLGEASHLKNQKCLVKEGDFNHE